MKPILARLKPPFWDHTDAAAGPGDRHFSFRRKWLLIIAFTTAVTLTPLVVMTLVDYRLTRQAFTTEANLTVSRLVSNSRRSVAFMLAQRRAALTFIVRDTPLAELMAPGRLATILGHLQQVMGGFVDLDIVAADRTIIACAAQRSGPATHIQPGRCFDQAAAKGFFISDVTATPDANPHPTHQLIIAVRHDLDAGSFFVLRATVTADLFDLPISDLARQAADDAFIINAQGVLQTPSRLYGNRFKTVPLVLPTVMEGTRVFSRRDQTGRPLLVGMAPIADSPFLLLLVRPHSGIMDLWLAPRLHLIGFLAVSIVLILFFIVSMATYLVNRIHAADQRRVQALHQVEYANKLASLGRLASGVAHEVNNPLAIINQKSGLIKDLFTLQPKDGDNARVVVLVDDVLAAVKRGATITRRLLDFARHMESAIEMLNIEATIAQILALMKKECERRGVVISQATEADLPEFACDRGNLQQVFLNLINNALAAMPDGGQLDIAILRHGTDQISVVVSDTGHGIAEADLKRVFEPFFSTRQGVGGTGLGLSITYGMVAEMGGSIHAENREEGGTRFIVTLPLEPPGLDQEGPPPEREDG